MGDDLGRRPPRLGAGMESALMAPTPALQVSAISCFMKTPEVTPGIATSVLTLHKSTESWALHFLESPNRGCMAGAISLFFADLDVREGLNRPIYLGLIGPSLCLQDRVPCSDGRFMLTHIFRSVLQLFAWRTDVHKISQRRSSLPECFKGAVHYNPNTFEMHPCL